jgi:hypothetical protein
MRRLPHRRVVHAEIAADGPDDDLTRVEPDPDLRVHAVRATCLFRVELHQFLHPQRRVARADSVVLVGEWRAEERHDPVAHHLVHRALVAVDSLHHPLEDGVENLRASSGSRSASSSMEPLRSAKRTVTCLRSPSSAALEVRIFSARCLGV